MLVPNNSSRSADYFKFKTSFRVDANPLGADVRTTGSTWQKYMTETLSWKQIIEKTITPAIVTNINDWKVVTENRPDLV